ncbi:molecular chaperone [Marinagarivorans algicola]|uniref:molecular chaperone n=1 Tax=Marinagarivorans algicola TaxID=1513270 RepID=UPI00155DCEBF|nr:molecular chaperone [Marinagarivorans algicola]
MTASIGSIAGFDYGTSNCALDTIDEGTITPIALQANSRYLPSLVYAETRDSIVEFVAANLAQPAVADYRHARQGPLRNAALFRREQGIRDDEQLVHFGAAAMAQYIQAPEEGFFAKSPKSFLGATGLSSHHLTFFEDVVSAMMLEVNNKAYAQTGQLAHSVVIGRPVNFASLNAEEGNRQALAILTTAAQRSGFKHIEFLYEPLAAGLAFEQSLQKDTLVLVLDIGGGTTDCSMMHMGPNYKHKPERGGDFLAHCGIRIGGNDLDINLATKAFMPLMGMHEHTKDGLPITAKYYLNAMRINDINAQSQFYSPESKRAITALAREVEDPTAVKRLIHMQAHQKNFSVIKTAEQSKIALSNQRTHIADLSFIEEHLQHSLTREALSLAIEKPLNQILTLIQETVSQAGTKPDLIFVTGGSGQSPMIRQAVQEYFGSIELVDGDHFGSVVTGLTQWAGNIFK